MSWICPQSSRVVGRVNGPVDNPASACMSCHSIAESPPSAPLIVSAKCIDDKTLNWFRNLAGSVPFGKVPLNSCDVQSDPDIVALDYSLQMRGGIANAMSGEWINPVNRRLRKPSPSSRQLVHCIRRYDDGHCGNAQLRMLP